MNILVLAGGYGTRLFPLTSHHAKALLEIAGKPVIEWIVNHWEAWSELETITIATNNKFAADFRHWTALYNKRHPQLTFHVLNNGSTNDSDKKGMIGDIHFSLNHEHLFGADLLVIGGDQMFSSPIIDLQTIGKQAPMTLGLSPWQFSEGSRIQKLATINAHGQLLQVSDKASSEDRSFLVTKLAYFRKETLPLIHQYLAEGQHPDHFLQLLEWLHHRIAIHTWMIPGIWREISDRATWEDAQKVFQAGLTH